MADVVDRAGLAVRNVAGYAGLLVRRRALSSCACHASVVLRAECAVENTALDAREFILCRVPVIRAL